jgi:uncharacterized OB-fold protein
MTPIILCKRCGTKIRSYSPMRKWCTSCRDRIRLEQAKARKRKKKQTKI